MHILIGFASPLLENPPVGLLVVPARSLQHAAVARVEEGGEEEHAPAEPGDEAAAGPALARPLELRTLASDLREARARADEACPLDSYSSRG